MPSLHFVFTPGEAGFFDLPPLPSGAIYWRIVATLRGGRGEAPNPSGRRNFQQTWSITTQESDPGPFTIIYSVGDDAFGRPGGWPNGGDGGLGDGSAGDGYGGGGGTGLNIISPAVSFYGYGGIGGSGGWSGVPVLGGVSDPGDQRIWDNSFDVNPYASFGAAGEGGAEHRGGNTVAYGVTSSTDVGVPGPHYPVDPGPGGGGEFGGEPGHDTTGGRGADAIVGWGGPGGGGGGGAGAGAGIDPRGGGGGGGGAVPASLPTPGDPYRWFGGGGRGQVFDRSFDPMTDENMAPSVEVVNEPGGYLELTFSPVYRRKGWSVGKIAF